MPGQHPTPIREAGILCVPFHRFSAELFHAQFLAVQGSELGDLRVVSSHALAQPRPRLRKFLHQESLWVPR